MRSSRISLSCVFLWAVLAGTPAHASCPANNALSTPAADFTINGDDTATHLKTGLMWKRCAEGLSTTTSACDTGGATPLNWGSALSVAATPFAGYSDWRLPNFKELDSIVETGCYGNGINEAVFPNSPSFFFWSSTTYVNNKPLAWIISFGIGFQSISGKGAGNYVRLVRGGQPLDSFDPKKKGQVITFGAAPMLVVGGTGTVSATGGASLNPVTFSSATPGVCTNSGSTVTGVTAGACIIAANQAGNATYNAAAQVTQSFSAGKGNQTISFGAAPGIVVGGSGNVIATATSGLAVSYDSHTTGICTVLGSTVTGVAMGICTITANQAGNANYYAAPQVMQNINTDKGSQTIIFGTAPTVIVGGTGTVSSTGGASGNPVTYSSTTPLVCTVSPNGAVTVLTTGTCTIAADQAGNASYNAAPQVTQSFAVYLGHLLNDTGQDTCYDGSALVACSAANSGDTTTYPRQDGRYGRDAAVIAGTLIPSSSGTKGFDFTRICMSGEPAGTGACPAIPVQGTGQNQWACTRDNVTHLIWSLESYTYNWTHANTIYPAAMNAANRCGYNTDWRLPTRRELFSIVHNGRGYPAIDTSYFPGTDASSISSLYWSANTYSSTLAWIVYFSNGDSGVQDRSVINYARLVRSGQ